MERQDPVSTTTMITRRAALERIAIFVGGALSAPVMAGVLGGCRAENGAAPAALEALDTDQHNLLVALTDHIIPATDTPGAREAGVPAFIDKMLADWFSDEDRQRFFDGLADVDAHAQQAHGARFAALTPEQQVALMTALDQAAYGTAPVAEDPIDQEDVAESAQQGTDAMQRERQEQIAGGPEIGGDPQAEMPDDEPAAPDGPPFFRTLKELTVAGYYTSKIGMTEELQWLAAPGRFSGDIPLAEVGRAWA